MLEGLYRGRKGMSSIRFDWIELLLGLERGVVGARNPATMHGMALCQAMRAMGQDYE